MSSATSTDPGLRPWQLFLLAGMLAATAVVLVSAGQTMSSIVVLSLTVVASSLVAVAAFQVLGPLLVADAPVETPIEGHARQALEREKALVLRSIKEIEFDHAMRKTASADFEELRGRLRARAVRLMQQLDASGYRDAVERDLATRAAASASRPPAGPATPAGLAAPAVAGTICAACQTANDGDARFCKQCGASLARPA
jgi:hypothetical protein